MPSISGASHSVRPIVVRLADGDGEPEEHSGNRRAAEARPVDDRAHAPPHLLAILRERDLLLRGHDLVAAALPHLLRDLVGEGAGRRSVLLGVGERAQAVEARRANEVEKLAVVRLRLAGEAADKRGPEREPGDLLAQPRDELQGLGLPGPPHAPQHRIRDVLERHVEVLHDFVDPRDRAHELGREVRGIGVENAQPRDTFDPGEPFEQPRERRAVAPVLPVLVGVLGDEQELLRPVCRELARLLEDRFFRLAAEAPPEGGNRAEGALVVAALRDAQVRVMARREAEPPHLRAEGL